VGRLPTGEADVAGGVVLVVVGGGLSPFVGPPSDRRVIESAAGWRASRSITDTDAS
jgi:hypothetical protein